MLAMSLLKSIEAMGEVDKIYTIADMLEKAGFECIERKRESGKKNLINYFYTKSGVDYVFCVIHNVRKNQICWTLIDYSTYESQIVANPDVIMNYIQREMGDFKIVLRSESFINTPIHRLVVDCKGKQVDHKTHNSYINIEEYLSSCTNKENCRNKKFYSKVDEDNLSFSVPASIVSDDERLSLLSRKFQVIGGRLISPEFNSEDDMYEALNAFESRHLGQFRYNPLIDFTDTWHALVIQKMLGDISDADLYEYNRNYMLSHHEDIVKYYRLAI